MHDRPQQHAEGTRRGDPRTEDRLHGTDQGSVREDSRRRQKEAEKQAKTSAPKLSLRLYNPKQAKEKEEEIVALKQELSSIVQKFKLEVWTVRSTRDKALDGAHARISRDKKYAQEQANLLNQARSPQIEKWATLELAKKTAEEELSKYKGLATKQHEMITELREVRHNARGTCKPQAHTHVAVPQPGGTRGSVSTSPITTPRSGAPGPATKASHQAQKGHGTPSQHHALDARDAYHSTKVSRTEVACSYCVKLLFDKEHTKDHNFQNNNCLGPFEWCVP